MNNKRILRSHLTLFLITCVWAFTGFAADEVATKKTAHFVHPRPALKAWFDENEYFDRRQLILEKLNLKSLEDSQLPDYGLRISRVYVDSQAENLGIQQGDYILLFDGRSPQYSENLLRKKQNANNDNNDPGG